MSLDNRQTATTDLESMCSRISHDLRTPLARLRMEIEVSGLPHDTRQAIEEDLAQIDHNTQQLWQYVRPVRVAPRVATDVSGLLKALAEHERHRIESLGGSLTTSLEPGLNACIASVDLECMIGNLLDNARRYGRSPDGHLTIALRLVADNDALIIDVSDRGPGIPPGDIARLRQPFSRGPQTHFDHAGVGLGLPIVERLLTQVGGSLCLLDHDGGGLIARITLPDPPNTRDLPAP